MAWLAILVAVLGGAANPFQSATNAELNKQLNQPVWATAVVYASGLAMLLVVLAFMRQAFPVGRAASVPWWAWLGGLISLGSTVAGLTMTQKLGSGLFTAASLTAGIVVSVLLDNFRSARPQAASCLAGAHGWVRSADCRCVARREVLN